MNRRNFLLNSVSLVSGMTASSLFAASGWQKGARLPDLSKYGLKGNIPKLQGQVVYLDFWASWCPPCKESFPVLNEWQKTLSPQGFLVLAVSVDESNAAMQAFLKKTPAVFPVVHDASQKLVTEADVGTLPTSFLVDRQGVIQHIHQGFRSKDAKGLTKKIQALLKA